MPEVDYRWLPRRDLLSFEELSALVDLFCELGTDALRLTGGEPLLREGLPTLVAMLAAKPALRDLALTTNGVLLEKLAGPLAEAGLHRLTVSLDTLRPERFEGLNRRPDLDRVLRGIEAAGSAGFAPLKIDTVVIRDINDDEICDMIRFGQERGAEVRFIEYMDVGGATRWSPRQVVPRREMLDRLEARFGTATPLDEGSAAPADRFLLPDGTLFGIISSTTAPFCDSCNRCRLTADGMWYLCLYATQGTDLRQALRGGAGPEDLKALIRGAWSARDDRGAVDRLALSERQPSKELDDLRRDPHLEMHTRGG